MNTAAATLSLPRRALLGTLAATALALGAAVPLAQAQDERVVVGPMRVTTYLNGGIGADEEQMMRKAAKDWPLRMIFSEKKDNEFVADVRLLVTNAKGAPVLMLHGAGPMTYAMLPAGKYRISASHKGQTETREVTLDGKTGRDVYFHWTGKAK
ncbi:hypothetical protein [Tibeticola sp.]|uniref:hypothetical protein n=1 Tax=Tibeticola sp. TaxID=2005368 RepID=UPI0025F00CD6|nr:hypothetical protein [Tibeticola sp.]